MASCRLLLAHCRSTIHFAARGSLSSTGATFCDTPARSRPALNAISIDRSLRALFRGREWLEAHMLKDPPRLWGPTECFAVDSGGPAEPVEVMARDDNDLEISQLNNFWERKFIATSFIDKPYQQIEIAAAAEMRVTIKPVAIPK